MANLNPRYIIGKTVSRVDLNPFYDDQHIVCHSPVIHFEDGSRITFTTEETGGSDYGTHISYWKPKRTAHE
jgi:hypothetical protein